MLLRDLDPQWLAPERDDEGRLCWREVATRAEAQGIMFLCPKCFMENRGPIGTHAVVCWSPEVPPEFKPGPGRWRLEGESYDVLSLVANSSSVQLVGGCNAHFFVRAGRIEQ